MGKKILVLTGSSRKGGNSDCLADALIRGAQAAGHTTVKFEAGHKKIGGCKACDRCFSNGKACVSGDDFNELAPLLEQSDVLVFATPLYFFNFPAQLKAAIDKMYAFFIAGKTLNIKECLLLACAETADTSEFDCLVKTYELTAAYKGWTDLGKLLVPSVNKKGDIFKTDALERAEALGKRIR